MVRKWNTPDTERGFVSGVFDREQDSPVDTGYLATVRMLPPPPARICAARASISVL